MRWPTDKAAGAVSVPGTLLGLLVVLPLVLASAPSAAWSQSSGVRIPDPAEVDEIFQRWNRTDGPGVQVAVSLGGEVVLSRGYGMADLDAAQAIHRHTTFDVASVSKQFTAFAVALLAEEGRLGLDDDVRRYVPELPAFPERVTLRQLVHHTGGVRDWVELLYLSGFHFDDVWEMQEILTLARSQKRLNFTPGAEYMYSNTGYNLLAETVARVSGMSFGEFMEKRVFGPLGMRSSHIHHDHGMITSEWATSYQPDGNGGYKVLVNNTGAVGSSSVISTAEDLARWLTNFYTGEVGGAGVLARMTERGILNNGDTLSYAFGVQVDQEEGRTAISHGGSWRGFRSQVIVVPELELGVAVVSNTTEFNSGSHARELLDLFAPELVRRAGGGEGGESQGGAAPAPPGHRLEEFRGRFRSAELLEVTHDVQPGEGDTLLWCIRRHGTAVLTPVGKDTFQTMGVRGTLTFHFQRDQEGRVSGFTLDGARFRNVEFHRTTPSAPGESVLSWCEVNPGAMEG